MRACCCHVGREEADLTIYWVALAAWAMLEAWVFGRERSRRGDKHADAGSLRILMTILGASVALAFYGAGTFRMARLPFSREAMLIGSLIMLSGIALRLWAILTLGAHFRTAVTLLEGHRLVTVGPYGRLRHPAYSGSLLTFAGLGIALGNSASLAILLVGPFLAYRIRIRVEERAMAEEFGAQWLDYAAARGALLPRFFYGKA